MLGLTGRKDDQKVLSLIEEGIFLLDWSLYLEGNGTGMILVIAWSVRADLLSQPWLLKLNCWDYMQENPPLSITTHVGGCYMLWTWKKNRLRNCRWRSGMIYCRGCLEWNWSLRNGVSSEMTWSIGATGTEVSWRRRVTSVWMELAPGEYGVIVSWLFGHVVSSCEDQFFTTTISYKLVRIQTNQNWLIHDNNSAR